MRAAAAMPATAAATFHLFVARHTAQFQRLRDILIHRLLHLVQILLRFDEPRRDRIRHERIALLLVIRDLLLRKLHALLLLVLQMLAFFSEITIQTFGIFIAEERVDLAAQTLVT